MKTSHGERDYPFGQAMLELRTQIGLTQAELARHLNVSRRAVGEWEAGSSYPKVAHLKELIALGVKQKAFSTGHEAEEIRALWKAARQKVLLDDHWLSSLLSQRSSPQEDTGPALMQETTSCIPVMARPTPGPRVDWGDALAIPTFYGREGEMAQLIQWVVQERCRMVSVLGMGGIGKSALLVSITHQLAVGTGLASVRVPTAPVHCPCPFDIVIFRSLRDAPLCEALIDECLHVLSPQPLGAPAGQAQGTVPTEERISLLLEHLRKARVLLVLDNLEGLLEEGDVRGCLRSGFEAYEQLLRRVAETAHQSCLLLTSREEPAELRELSGKYSPVRSLCLTGLDVAACKQLFMEKELIGTEAEREHLIEIYGGNPLALKIVSETIMEFFGGEIGQFLVKDTVIFGCITDLLDEQFARLSALEQSVLCWLAIMREPVTLDELQALLISSLPQGRVVEAVDSLRRRSLIEPGKRPGYFVLQSVVLEYVTSVLIAEGSHEIRQRQLRRLIEHGLSQARSKEYVRQAQERLLVSPLLTHLRSEYWRRADLEERLLCLLDQLRQKAMDAQGYGPANLIALLRLLRGNLSGLDLSHLCIQGAYLQGIEMREVSLAFALIRDTILTEAVNATWTVAISPDGRWWAAGSLQGQVRVWAEESRALHRIWQAHSNIVYSLAFSPDGRTLASGSLDDTIKLWDVESGSLLWIGWQRGVQSLAFTPDGGVLASGGRDATVRLWETGGQGAGIIGAPLAGAHSPYGPRGTAPQTLAHASPVYAVAFSPDGRLLASGCFDGQLRLWARQETSSCAYVEIRSIQTGWVRDLAFAPDSKTLASAHLEPSDRAVKLWEVESGQLLHTFPELHGRRLAWSPNGRVLAGHSDKTIWLWNVEQGQYQAALHGHVAEVYGLSFSPDSCQLLSSSADGMLRVWNVESGQCLHIIAGYGVTINSLSWSSDATYLVSGGTDTLVTIWDVSAETAPTVLRGHSWIVDGVSWSPDGRFVVSCSWDRTIRLWDATSHACVQIFECQAVLQCIAWSPDGSLLACGTFQRGVQVWDVRAGHLRWVGQPYQITFTNVAWSPDGTRLASGGDDGSVYLWKSADGMLLQRLSGHHGWVVSVGWSPDGTRLAGGNRRKGGELFVWDVQSIGARTGQGPVGVGLALALSFALGQPGDCPCPVQTFTGHSDHVYAVVWSPSGDQLISGDTDGMLRWWDVESGACVRTQAAHQGTIRSLRVSPDGTRLASCGDDGAIMVWDLQSFEHLRTLRCDRPYERLNITGIRGLTEAEITSLRTLGAIDEVTLAMEESRCVG